MRPGKGKLRLLPWSGADGRPRYLDAGPDGDGMVSRLADEEEARQLAEATRLLRCAVEALREPGTTGPQAHNLAARLCASLRDVLRVAESRGRRLRP